jgi:hypothetical protein
MDISNIIRELHELGVLKSHLTESRALRGGTSSSVFAVLNNNSPLYVIKLNDSKTIKAESLYLNIYTDIELLPRFIYVDREYRYLVYTYKPGKTQYARGKKDAMLMTLVRDFITKHKTTEEKHGYGYQDDPVESWKDFHLHRAIEAKSVIKDRLTEKDHNLIHSLINKMDNKNIRYLLHGDCGIHNFLFIDGILSGVIDPTPVIGEPIYDLVYAFCSSPDELNIDTIQQAANELGTNLTGIRDLNEEVIKGLYYRIATCIQHHPIDLNEYLMAWNYWKERVL